jgi:hypothetical protein
VELKNVFVLGVEGVAHYGTFFMSSFWFIFQLPKLSAMDGYEELIKDFYK